MCAKPVLRGDGVLGGGAGRNEVEFSHEIRQHNRGVPNHGCEIMVSVCHGFYRG